MRPMPKEKTVCKLVREMIKDEKKAGVEYSDILEKLKANPCCSALINKIMKDEQGHFKALKTIEPYVCKK